MSKGWGIKPLTRTRLPASLIVVAVVPSLSVSAGDYTESWKCAEAHFVADGALGGALSDGRGIWHPADLWSLVSGHCRGKGLTFLWVHDLHKTARLTALFDHLPNMGFTLEALSLNPTSSWLVWRRGRDTLKICDVMSIWPTGLDRIGQLFGLARKDTSQMGEHDLSWRSVAIQDLEILTVAMAEYFNWVMRSGFGTLSVTGNGQAWSAFRARFMDHGILVHDDEELHAMERRAMWTGRAEAWWRGAWLDQPVDEWDFANAHTNIAATHDMPVFPHRPISPTEDLQSHLDDDQYLVLAEVDVETDTPCVPAVLGDGIGWPVGRFTTTLWTPELRLVLDAGKVVRLHRGQLYRRAPALRRWADWLLTQLAADDNACPAWQKDILKRWGNTFIGRFAMRYPQWEHIGTSAVSDVHCTPCVDVQTGEEFSLMQVGYELWKQSGLGTPHNQSPAITSYIMSVMRAKLWTLMAAMPAESLLYVDTDSLLVTDAWRDLLTVFTHTYAGEGLRLKRSWNGMAIYGPRQLVTGDQVRVSGLPRVARRTGRHDWEGEVTESLLESLANRRTAEVRIMPRQWHIEGTDSRRDGPAVGWTRAKHIDTLK